MGFFDDEPFENIVREFFGDSAFTNSRRQFIRGEEEERNIDFIDGGDYVYLVFELPGYSKKDINVLVKGKQLEIIAIKKEKDCENGGVASYLKNKLCTGIIFRKTLPNSVIPKHFKTTVKNGVLEIVFSKK